MNIYLERWIISIQKPKKNYQNKTRFDKVFLENKRATFCLTVLRK